MTHLEQQIAELIDWLDIPPGQKLPLSSAIDTLIEATHQAAIEECVRVAEDMASKTVWKAGGVPHINAADLINAIKSR